MVPGSWNQELNLGSGTKSWFQNQDLISGSRNEEPRKYGGGTTVPNTKLRRRRMRGIWGKFSRGGAEGIGDVGGKNGEAEDFVRRIAPIVWNVHEIFKGGC